MKVLFQNKHIVFVEKAPGVLSVPSRHPDKDQRQVLGLWLQRELKTQIFPVHRLDAEVGGLMIYALNADAHKFLNRAFENKKVSKTYEALSTATAQSPVEIPLGEKQTWTCKILRGKKRSYESPHGDPSITEATLIAQNPRGLYWHLSPITGRSHQLRYEMYRQQSPILGDVLYSGEPWEQEGIALRAFRLDFSEAQGREKFEIPELFEIAETLRV